MLSVKLYTSMPHPNYQGRCCIRLSSSSNLYNLGASRKKNADLICYANIYKTVGTNVNFLMIIGHTI